VDTRCSYTHCEATQKEQTLGKKKPQERNEGSTFNVQPEKYEGRDIKEQQEGSGLL